MDTFRFLKYWKTHGAFAVNCGSNVRTANTTTSTILAAASHHPSSTDADGIESYGKSNLDCANYMGNEDDDDEFFKFTEPIDLFLNGSEPNEKSRASAIKSAAVFRVLTSRLKKSNTNGAEKTESNASVSTTANQKQRILNPNRRSNVSNSDKQRISAESGLKETRFSTNLVQKYFKGVKPMYIRVSKRYNDKKLRLKSPRNLRSGQSQPSRKSNSTSSMAVKSPPVILKTWKQGNFPARMPKKNLGKRRSSASSPGLSREKRRDDSLLEKEDGIRSAILHCKRSFNGSRSRDSESSNLRENCSEELREAGNGVDGSEVEIICN